MPIDVKLIKGKHRLVHRGTNEPVMEWDDDSWEGHDLDYGGFDNENEAIAKKASEISKRKINGRY